MGIAVVGMGSALSIAASGDWRLLPAVMGISLGLLLSSIGVANFWSVRWPYPAVKPGDSAFNQPQTAGTPAIPAQISAMLLPVLFVLPAVVLAVVGVVSALPPLTIVAAIVGIVSGAVVFFAFTAVSVQHWDRNGPELLEAAERA